MIAPQHLHVLLDADGMAGRLQALQAFAGGSARLAALAVERIWVKPGRHVHVSYHVTVEVEGEPHATRAVAALAASEGELRAMERRAVATAAEPPPIPLMWDARRSTVRCDAPPMLLQLFPWDYRLPTLPLALASETVGRAVESRGLGEARVVGYWPGMRCQLRYADGEGSPALFGKVFTDEDGARSVARTLQVLGAGVIDAGFSTPRLHACLPALRLVLTEPLPGASLLGRLASAAGDETFPRLARALARFHALRPPHVERVFSVTDDLAVVRGWVAFVAGFLPELGDSAAAALVALESSQPSSAGAPGLVHRDFYDKQLLVGDGALGLLDLDTACLGDGEIDVGNFCAHLLLRSLQVPDQQWDPVQASRRFVDVYRAERRGADPERIRWYRASALLRLACVYALRPWWPMLGPRLIAASRNALEE